MLRIRNTEVWGLGRAIKASGNAMTVGEINTLVENEDKDYKRGERLGSTPVGSAHDHFLLGIHVQFDIIYPQYWTIEAERYHNFEIITSQSKMHRLTIMGKEDGFADMFNKYVDEAVIIRVKSHIEWYNYLISMERKKDNSYYSKDGTSFSAEEQSKRIYEAFMKCISNLPMGFEMGMTCDLTYLQLKTLYQQRKNHKLKEDWGAFCDWCLTLPRFKELTGIGND